MARKIIHFTFSPESGERQREGSGPTSGQLGGRGRAGDDAVSFRDHDDHGKTEILSFISQLKGMMKKVLVLGNSR